MSLLSSRIGAPALVAALSALGCSAELEQYTTDADTGSTHAFITVQRSVHLDGDKTRAEAFAGFLRVPADADSRPLFELLGVRTARPPLGQCRVDGPDTAAPAPSTFGRVELLEAGEVLLGTGGAETSLAPHAFPSVTDSISGVVYTTRDRSAVFPAALPYAVRTTGGTGIPSLNVSRNAPAELEAVTVGGLPVADVDELAISQPVDLTWAVGMPGDVVYAELGSADGATSVVCAFRDEAGAGSIPAGKLGITGAGRLSLHRARTTPFAAPGVDAGELAFDFELATSLSLVP